VVVFGLSSVQAQNSTNTEEGSWVAVLRALLEIQKNSNAFFGPLPEFEKRNGALIDVVKSFLAPESKLKILVNSI
jgi:hypothetical protein